MLFLSQLVGKPVLDLHGAPFGRVRDLIVALGEEYPPVTGIVVRVSGDRDIFLPWTDVDAIDESGARLHTSSIDITNFQQRPNEIRLWLDLQDKQIVDVEGRKIVRVNDIQLAPVRGRLRLIAVDVGLAGILRRLGLSGPGERLARALGLPIENYIEWKDVDPVESSVSSLKLRVPHQALSTLHPADVAHIVEQLAPRDRAGIMAALEEGRAADVLEELSAEDQVDVLDDLPSERAADILEEMGPDEAADLIADLPEKRRAELLGLMEPEEAQDVRELLAYGEETAGGLMTTDFITVSADETAQQVIDRLRELKPEADHVYYLYVTEADGTLIGTITLRGLIIATPETRVRDFTRPDPISVTVDTDADEAARAIARYNLLALPVVDDEGRMQGVVTVDDAFERALGEGWRRRLPEIFEPVEER
ncbi:MAG: CBS domain-containing protein [Chloroflexota bacterium]|jgi:magnesium transporter|nr:CBS domain-containing protein [Chloroflexota bacterium]